MNRGVNSAANSSGLSVGASSLVTDANSALSSGSHLQRSASINTDSYYRLPASPMSFSSNNLSGSSTMDGGSIVQQTSHHDQSQKRGASSATSLPALQEPGNHLMHPLKKTRLDTRQEDMQQQVLQQLLQRQDSLQLQRHQNLQMHALMQQKMMQERHQQQLLQSLPPQQRAQMQHQQQLRQQLQQQALQQQALQLQKRPSESGICARRLMQFMYHQRHRPPDNNIMYWRKFVTEYFAPRAKKKWCLSSYDNVGNHALGVFPPSALDAWHCDICGSKSGKGFETTFEVLPRLCKIKFDSGVIDELLYLDMPHECRLGSGIMVLEYAKAIQESVYEQLRVVREGQLRIIFAPDLKIMSWEFCARSHEEFISRRSVAPQVNQLLQVSQKYQTALTENGPSGVSPQDLQTNCNLFVAAGRQLVRNLELQSLNDLGFSKRFVRCLQIAEVVNSMKDLINFSRRNTIGPIESLKTYPRQVKARLQNENIQEADQLINNPQSLPNDQNLNKLSNLRPGMSSQINRSNSVPGLLSNLPQGTIALNNYQALLRQNSINSNQSAPHPDVFRGSSPAQTSVSFQGPVGPSSSSQEFMSNTLANASSAPQKEQSLQHSQDGNISQKSNLQSSQASQYYQQHAIQQMLQGMMNSNRGLPVPNMRNSAVEDSFRGGFTCTGEMPVGTSAGSAGNGIASADATSMPKNAANTVLNRTNSLNSVASNSAVVGTTAFQMRQDMPPSPQYNDIIESISHDFGSGELFGIDSSELDY